MCTSSSVPRPGPDRDVNGMRFRTRVLVALIIVAVVPLIGLAIGVRREMDRRLTAQYEARASGVADVTRDELTRESASIADRLASLCGEIAQDNRLRLAIAVHDPSERGYLLDYAGEAMRLTGLAMLQIQDSAGRILSSGHFRNEFDRLEPDLPALLAAAPAGAALVDARTASGPMRVIARADSLRLAGRRLTIVGGLAVTPGSLRALAPDSEFNVTLIVDSAARSGDAATRAMDVAFPFIGWPAEAADTGRRSILPARFVITHSTDELTALRWSLDQWVAAAIALGILTALIGAGWLATQVSSPLSRLAEATTRLDLDRLDVAFGTDRADEVGDLSRLLDIMTRRLRASAARVRESERRATIGDVARQVNHDVKNGLVPIRHVLRHLAHVQREDPERLASVFAERRATLDASVDYLDALARNYARLSHAVVHQPCDLNALARAAAASAAADDRVSVRLELDPSAPIVTADALLLRRVLDNLVSNAVDAVAACGGAVTIGTDGASAAGVRLLIRDTGPGMTEAQLARAFEDFHTTKPNGVGLGLSIVRRLTGDLGAALRVQTAPGQGTMVEVELPRIR